MPAPKAGTITKLGDNPISIVLAGFEPTSTVPKTVAIDHYAIGLLWMGYIGIEPMTTCM